MTKGELDKSTVERFEFLNRNYLPIAIYHLNEGNKIYLGDEIKRKCRFCGKDESETTFNNVSHALPEFIGNEHLIAYYECDECNGKYGRLLESHMAHYMNLWHTLAQVKGKKGVPSFQSRMQKSRIDLTKKAVEISESVDDIISVIDEVNKTITISSTRPSYIPIAIYKCLTKMALTVMPEEEMEYFKATLKWINEERHNESLFDLKSLYALFSMAPGVKPFWFVTATLFKRKENAQDKVPYMIFLLAYANFTFQIYLPLCEEDIMYSGEKFDMVYIPNPIDMVEGTDSLIRKTLNFNKKTLVKGEKVTMRMGFNHMEETPQTEKE